MVARTVGQKLSEKWGQPVVVDNRAGAGGSIGTDAVAKTPADGYTLLMVGTGFTVIPQLTKGLPWSPADFRGVLNLGSVPNIVVVPTDLPVRTVGELLALARKSPGSLTYGSPGIGSSPHLSGEMLAQMADVKLLHVPYKGQPEALNDLLGGRISMMALSAALAGPHVKSGKLRAIGVTAGKRLLAQPDLPTVAESAGLPGYDVRPWTGVFVPVRTPDAIVRKIAAAMTEVLALPDVKARLEARRHGSAAAATGRVRRLHRHRELALGRGHPQGRHHHAMRVARRLPCSPDRPGRNPGRHPRRLRRRARSDAGRAAPAAGRARARWPG